MLEDPKRQRSIRENSITDRSRKAIKWVEGWTGLYYLGLLGYFAMSKLEDAVYKSKGLYYLGLLGYFAMLKMSKLNI